MTTDEHIAALAEKHGPLSPCRHCAGSGKVSGYHVDGYPVRNRDCLDCRGSGLRCSARVVGVER